MSETQAKNKKEGKKAGRRPAPDSANSSQQAPPVPAAALGPFYTAGPVFGLGAPVQRKVIIGRPNDAYEQEADLVAERVTAGRPASPISTIGPAGLSGIAQRQSEEAGSEEETAQTLPIQRQSEEEETTQTLALQRQDEGEGSPGEDETDEQSVQTAAGQKSAGPQGSRQPTMQAAAHQAIHSKGPGESLRPNTQRALESSMRVDLSDVRVHQHPGSQTAAKQLKARAFTHKKDIWLGAGESQNDLKLMAHESTHVLQQDGIVRRKIEPQQAQAGSTTTQGEEEEEESTTPGSATPAGVTPAATGQIEQQPPERPAIPGQQSGPELATSLSEGGGESQGEPQETNRAEDADEQAPMSGLAAGLAAAGATGASPAASAAVRDQATQESAPEQAPAAPETVTAGQVAGGSDAQGPQRLRQVMNKVGKLSRGQQGVAAIPAKARAASKKRARAASKATPSPANEATAMGMGSQVETMAGQKKEEVDKKSFLELVKSKLREMEIPKNPTEMGGFKKGGGASGLKGAVTKGAKDQQAKAQGQIATATAAEPKPAVPRVPEPLPAPDMAPAPRRIGSQNVLPPPKIPG